MPESEVEAAWPQPRVHTKGFGEKGRAMSTLMDHCILKRGRYDDVPVCVKLISRGAKAEILNGSYEF